MSIFVLDLKNGKLWANIIGCELRVVSKQGETSHGPSVFAGKDAPFLWVYGGYFSRECLMTCFRGDRGGQKILH